jgi:hypothetical protein
LNQIEEKKEKKRKNLVYKKVGMRAHPQEVQGR